MLDSFHFSAGVPYLRLSLEGLGSMHASGTMARPLESKCYSWLP